MPHMSLCSVEKEKMKIVFGIAEALGDERRAISEKIRQNTEVLQRYKRDLKKLEEKPRG